MRIANEIAESVRELSESRGVTRREFELFMRNGFGQ